MSVIATVTMLAAVAAVAAPATAATPATVAKPLAPPISPPVAGLPAPGAVHVGLPAGVPGAPPAQATVVDSETTPTRRVVHNPDGSFSAQVSTQPARFKGPSGNWVENDLSLTPAPDGTLVAKAASQMLHLPARADGATTFDTPAGPIALRHPDGVGVPATVAGETAAFAAALDGSDLAVSLTPNGLKETVTVRSAAGAPAYRDQFTLPPGVTARDTSSGVEFVDGAGSVVAAFGRGVAYDTFPPGPRATAVSVRILAPSAPTAGPMGTTAVTVEVGVDPAWFAAAARPVTIDPTLTLNGATAPGALDTFVHSGSYASTSYWGWPWLTMGNNNDGTMTRSLLYFDLGTAPGANVAVSESHLAVLNFASPACNSPRSVNVYGLAAPFNTATTWNNQPSLDGAGVVSTSAPFALGANGCAGAYVNLDTTSLAGRWMNQSAPNNGL